MLLLELSHTSHTAAETGIQQVCRRLFAVLSREEGARALVHDRYMHAWRTATDTELHALSLDVARRATRKGASWSAREKARGRLMGWLGMRPRLPRDIDAVLFPEFVTQRCFDALDALRAQTDAPFAAVFHDCIALKLPQFSAAVTIERQPAYLAGLARMDAIAAVSEASRRDLLDYWQGAGITDTPPVEVIHLGIAASDVRRTASREAAGEAPLQILCVSTLEGRKNHLALLDATERLWDEGLRFDLELVGMAHRELGTPIVGRIRALQEAGRPLRWLGSVDNDTLHARYAACDFTVYPSVYEGFGLPVLESMAHGKPCVCTTAGGLDEVSRGGGCLRMPGTSANAIAAGMRSMLTDPGLRGRLTREAVSRHLRTWDDYAHDVSTWLKTVRRRA